MVAVGQAAACEPVVRGICPVWRWLVDCSVVGRARPALLALWCALFACSEEAVDHCGAGVCPAGTECDPGSGSCVPVDAPDVPVGELGLWLSAGGAPDGALLVASYDRDFGALVLSEYGQADPSGAPAHRRLDGGPDPSGGNDVGAYPSLIVEPSGRASVAYYDRSQRALKIATIFGATVEVETADSGDGHDVGRWAALAVDGAGGRHVAYRDETGRRLRVLSLADGGCRPEGSSPTERLFLEVGPDAMKAAGMPSQDFGAYASIGITGDGALVTSFFDAERGNLVLATCKGSVVDLRIIDGESADEGGDTGEVGLWSSLAIDGEGSASIAYYDRTRGVLKLARSDQGAIEIEVVDDGTRDGRARAHLVGQGAQLALHGKLARVVYLDATERSVRLARRSGHGTWTSVVVSAPLSSAPGLGGIGLGLDLLVTSEGSTHVVYGTWTAAGSGITTEVEHLVVETGAAP